MDLKESASEKKKARRDHSLVWEARPGDPRNVGETKFRVNVEVAGDRASSARDFWKPPETYARARERQNFISIAIGVLRIAVLAFGIVAALWIVVRKIRQGRIEWRPTLRLAVPGGAADGGGSAALAATDAARVSHDDAALVTALSVCW